nr:restriction endonuclease [Rheinheimera soli]
MSGVKYQALQTLGFYGRFVFPFFLLAGSVASFFARRKRIKLLATARNIESSDPFSTLSWHDFELLVGQYFRELGYSVAETSFGADGGNFFYGCSRYPGCKGVRDATAEAQPNSEIRA